VHNDVSGGDEDCDVDPRAASRQNTTPWPNPSQKPGGRWEERKAREQFWVHF
jgi:hypothetical protein